MAIQRSSVVGCEEVLANSGRRMVEVGMRGNGGVGLVVLGDGISGKWEEMVE